MNIMPEEQHQRGMFTFKGFSKILEEIPKENQVSPSTKLEALKVTKRNVHPRHFLTRQLRTEKAKVSTLKTELEESKAMKRYYQRYSSNLCKNFVYVQRKLGWLRIEMKALMLKRY